MADFKIDIAYSKFDGIKASVAKSNPFQFKRFSWKNHMIYYSQKFCTERIFDTNLKILFLVQFAPRLVFTIQQLSLCVVMLNFTLLCQAIFLQDQIAQLLKKGFIPQVGNELGKTRRQYQYLNSFYSDQQRKKEILYFNNFFKLQIII